MATANFTTSDTNLELQSFSNQIHTIASTLAGVSPSLLMLRDGGVSPENGNILTLISGLADRLNQEMYAIADQLQALGKITV